MPNATTDTRIIFVHGMGAKPPAEDLHALYKKALIENVRIDNGSLAADMESNGTLFVSAYWANAVPDHIEDSTESIQKLTAAVERVIQTRRDLGNDMHISRKGWVKATAETFGLTIVNALGTALTIKDNVINEHAREVRLYKNDQLIADRIRTPLETALRKAWDDPTISRTVIISHSMGTFISYDVRIPFTRRFAVYTTLDAALAAERTGILAWCVRGTLRWQSEGLDPPSLVTSATAEYEADSDPLREFLDACCVVGPDDTVTSSDLYASYGVWADREGLTPRDRLSHTGFGRHVGDRFKKKRQTGGRVVYVGVGTKAVKGLDQ